MKMKYINNVMTYQPPYQQRYDVLFTHFEVQSIALPRFTFIIHNEFMTEIKTLQQC